MTNETDKEEREEILLPGDGGEKRRPRRDFFGALAFLAIAAAFVIEALRMPFNALAWQWYTAPNIFPLAMAVCLGAAALFVAVRGFLGWHANRNVIPPMRWAASAREWGMPRFLAGAAMIAGLIWLLGKIDFYLLAPGAIVVFGLVFRSDPLAKALKSALIAAVFILAFLFIISKVFGIVFP